MEWVAIVTMIIEMVQKCRENRDAEAITADALNRPLGRWMIRAHLRDEGIRGKRLRSAMRQVKEKKISNKEIEAFIENALDA